MADANNENDANKAPSSFPDQQHREQLLRALRKEEEALLRLPAQSSYASHRLRVTRRAIQLLTPADDTHSARRTPTSDETDELQRLLASLSL